MIIQYNIVVTIVNLIDNSTSKFNKVFDAEITTATDALLYNNYHVLSKGVYILDMFEDEVNAYCKALGIEESSIEIDEFEIVSLTERTDVFFESEGEDNSLSLRPIIKCYVYPKNDALKVPNLIGTAYDSTTIIWSWPEDEQYAHYLIEEAIDPNSEADKSKIIAQLPIGATSYTETGLEPDTPYTRRLINYTDEQTSVPSASVTVMTETVEASESLEEYAVPKNYDFTTDDSEREIIEENLYAFHSGIGDGNDLKVYKQMDADFYQQFKAYFELTGRRTQREKRYEQVGFNYKICLEAEETIEEQEGEVTFDVDVYPREEISLKQYMYGTMPVNVYAKLYATIFLRKESEETDLLEVVTKQENWNPGKQVDTFIGTPLNIVFVIDKTNSIQKLPLYQNPNQNIEAIKGAAIHCIEYIEDQKNKLNANITDENQKIKTRYCIISFAQTATQLTSFVDANTAINTIGRKYDEGIIVNGTGTSWGAGLNCATNAIINSGMDGEFVTYFFSDGFPNTISTTTESSAGSNYAHPSGAYYGINQEAIIADLQTCANDLKAVSTGGVACLISTYSADGTYQNYIDKSSGSKGKHIGYFGTYIQTCHSIVPTEGGQLVWNDEAGLRKAFESYVERFTTTTITDPVFTGHTSNVIFVQQPYSIDKIKAVQVETELIGPFTFDEDITGVYYSKEEQRAIIDPSDIIGKHSEKMTKKSVYDLILDAAKETPEWEAGYNQTIGTTDGSFLIKGLFIKDTYGYADEDTMDDKKFDDSNLEDGMVGSVNVYTDIDTLETTDYYGDDCYIVSEDNYLYIDGYTDGIIYDGTRYVTTELNAYSHPSEILISTEEDYRSFLLNRKNQDFEYTGKQKDITSVIKILEIGDDIWLEGEDYKGLNKAGDEIIVEGINEDLIAHNDTYYESPVLNYRFNLEDPDAKTPLYEILPDCNPASNYLNIVILHVYYAKNVYITDEDNYVESFGDDPIATTSSEYMTLKENVYKWTQMEWRHGKDNSWYIDNYLWFMAKPMKKRQEYYDELPGPGIDTFYGLVNGRYRSDNQSGKKDLIVDTPQFNIPTTVHKDTIRIYVVITEFYPDTALVSYRWENPWNNKDGITQVNGDYVTFSSDSLTYKDIEYYDVISTINMENQEIFDNKTTEKLYEIPKPNTIYDYTNYYLEVSTDNSDVLAMRYPTEITFDENGLSSVGVAFKGVVNATSQWAPRIHNGYYYLNQHEYFAYSEFDVEANFDTYEETNFKRINGYVSFDVQLRHKADPAEHYSITKDTRSELLQNEKEFQWIDDKGLTLKPYINGEHYREYLGYMYYSPVILFKNTLTEAGPLNVSYYFEDGSEFLPMEIRSYNTEEGKWSEWTTFENNTVPAVPLSCAYQVRFNLVASVQNQELFLEDYLCCYLDWKEDMNVANTTNISTIADHMTTGPDKGKGIYISKIFDFGCETELTLDMFESYYKKHIQLYIGYSSNNSDSLLLENISWTNISSSKDKGFKGRYFRYKIVIPEGEKLYWLRKRIQTLETHELLPYVTGISMTGTYTPSDVVTNFVNTEAFEILKDGEFHTVFDRVIDVIGADVLERGYTEQEIEYVKIQCTTEDIEIQYDENLDAQYPYTYLNKPIEAKSDMDVNIVIKNTPYIFVEKDDREEYDIIKITGTPQQYCPITVEDTEGNSYIQLHNATSFVQTETFLLTEETKYLELKTNRYDNSFTVYKNGQSLGDDNEVNYEVYVNDENKTKDFEVYINDTKLAISDFKVYVDDGELDSTQYRVVNHLIIFNEPIGIGHTITVEYCITRSFIAIVDRPNNTTTIYLYPGKGIKTPEKCKVYFETSTKNNKFVAQDLSLNPIYRTDYKGFIYLTDEHTEPYSLKIYCNPLRLKAGGYDKVDVSIEVLDIKDNPVVSKEVAVDCEYGILNCESYETDINGVVHLVYESAYLQCTDKLTARVLTDDNTVIEQSITIINE